MMDEVPNWVVSVDSAEVGVSSLVFSEWLPWEDSSHTRFIRLFNFRGSWGSDVVGVTPSVWLPKVTVLPRIVVWFYEVST